MAEFTVYTKKALDNIAGMENIEKKLKECADRVNEIKKELNMSVVNELELRQELNVIGAKVIQLAAHMDSFSQALEAIMNVYTTEEEKIVGYSVGENTSDIENASLTGTDKRKWYQKFWDWLTHKEVNEYTATSDEQEKAADIAMQKKIQELTNSEKYSKENWSKASLEEREKLLNEYLNEVADYLGVDVKKSINFFNEAPKDGYVTNGYYSHGKRSISINTCYDLPYSTLTTIIHELRHAYQHCAVDNPTRYQVSQETINAWKESFRTYSREQAKGYDAYRNIVVERDARAFAGQD